jgi:hypothetical protein
VKKKRKQRAKHSRKEMHTWTGDSDECENSHFTHTKKKKDRVVITHTSIHKRREIEKRVRQYEVKKQNALTRAQTNVRSKEEPQRTKTCVSEGEKKGVGTYLQTDARPLPEEQQQRILIKKVTDK